MSGRLANPAAPAAFAGLGPSFGSAVMIANAGNLVCRGPVKACQFSSPYGRRADLGRIEAKDRKQATLGPARRLD